MSAKKVAEDYCEAVEGEFAWFSQLCMRAAVANVVQDGDEYGVCADHMTDEAIER